MTTISDVMDVLGQISKEVERLPARIKIAANQVTVVTGLSDITKRLGLVTAGEFRTGNDKEPGFGFTGVRIGYPPFSYESQDWNVVGVNNDVLQFGLSATDGKAYFGAGSAIIDENGVALPQGSVGVGTDDTSAFKWQDGSNNITSYLQDAEFSTYTSLTLSHQNYTLNNFVQLDMAAYDNGDVDFLVNIGTDAFFSCFRDADGQDNVSVNADTTDVDFLVYGDNGLVLQVNAGLDRLEIMNVGSTAVHILDGAGTSYFNEPNNDVDVIFEGTTDSNLIYVDAGLDAVGFGGAAESGYKVKVTGDLKLTNIINFDERASDPSTPSTGDWGLYFKSDGLYVIDDAGATTGPLSTGSATDGTYTPTLTGTANVDATTAFQCMYTRTGDVVTVEGQMNIDPTSSATATTVGISLPISSTFSNDYECSGLINSTATYGFIYADTSNNRAELRFISASDVNRAHRFSFSYRVL